MDKPIIRPNGLPDDREKESRVSMPGQHTPWDTVIRRADINGYSPEVIAELEAKAEGYRRCFSDFAPLLEAAKAGGEFLDWWLRTSQVEQVNALHGEKGNAMIGRLKMQREQLHAALDAIERRSA